MEPIKNNNYQNLLQELRGIIEKGQHQAYKAVDNLKVQTYWQIGERIIRGELRYQERADYGKYLIDNLVIDLNVERRLLYRIVKFYKLYPIVVSLIPQLSWTHYYWLVDISNNQERKFYETKIINNSWSIRELSKQIKNQLCHKTDSIIIEITGNMPPNKMLLV